MSSGVTEAVLPFLAQEALKKEGEEIRESIETVFKADVPLSQFDAIFDVGVLVFC